MKETPILVWIDWLHNVRRDPRPRSPCHPRRRHAEADILREAAMRPFRDARTAASAADSTEELRRFLRGQSQFGAMEINLSGARRERELLRQGAGPDEIRALAWDTGSSASLVPTTLARTLYEYMEASSAMFRAPTSRLVTTSGEPMQLPYLSAHSIGTQVSGQGTALAGTDPTFARLALDAFKYGQLVKVSAETIDDAAFDIAGFLGRDIGRSLGRLIGTDLVTGTGSGKPRGLMIAAAAGGGSVTTGGSLIGPTYDSLVSLV